MITEELFEKLGQLAMREWRLSPSVFYAQCEAGEIWLEDLAGLVLLLSHDPLTALWLDKYLFPELVEQREREAKQAKWARNIKQLQLLAKMSRQRAEQKHSKTRMKERRR